MPEPTEIQIHDVAVHCNGCGARFHPSETHRDSGGYCECGGELILEQEAWVRAPDFAETLRIKVVKDSDA